MSAALQCARIVEFRTRMKWAMKSMGVHCVLNKFTLAISLMTSLHIEKGNTI